MKKILISLIISFISVFTFSQVPYSWTTGVNPGWTSSNPSVNTLSWQSYLAAVSTSDTYAGGTYFYNNNQTTTYTSPIRSTLCPNTAFVNITFQLGINLENNYDFLRFQYSINGGTTWTTYGTWTGNLGLINITLNLPESATARFRFIFTSDVNVNSYGMGPFTTYAYYADIYSFNVQCITYLPVELTEFVGYNKVQNILDWKTASESNNDYFTIDHSIDNENWTKIAEIDGNGSTTQESTYQHIVYNFRPVVNYYRLSQTDNDGTTKIYKSVAIDNRGNNKEIVKVVNTLGQEVNDDTKGIVYIIYVDGTTSKIYR